MDNSKFTGSYYTPKTLCDFLMSHINKRYINKKQLSILEPSCGDGQFLSSFFDSINIKHFKRIEIDIVDINKSELEKAIKCIPKVKSVILNPICADYLNEFLSKRNKYDLIIGNPPYIRKKNMKQKQIEICEECHKVVKKENSFMNSNAKINNIWTAFVEANICSLNQDGILCLVIPADIMQVNYAKELRSLFKECFDRVEIFAFNELIFDGIQQDVIAIIGIKNLNEPEQKGFSFYQVNDLEDLKEPKFTEKHSNIHRTTLNKWTNYILTDDELNFIEKIKEGYSSISTYCSKISAGIVTAANDYFIINSTTLKENNLQNEFGLVKKILPKGSAVSNLIDFSIKDFNKLLKEDKRVNFVHIPDIPFAKLPKNVKKYILKEESSLKKPEGLDVRFKMTQRNNWYHVPNVWSSRALFIKRSDSFPKIILNNANVNATDSFYRIIPKKEYGIENIVFGFYNSLTLLLAELEGRFYGGGVLELTPNEFKNLIIPYPNKITNLQFEELDSKFRNCESLNDILDYTDNILLKNLPKKSIKKLRNLRQKLVDRRLKADCE